jgi:hypothetical protein
MSEENDLVIAALRASGENQMQAEREFHDAEVEFLLMPRPDIAGHTAEVMGKLLLHVEARKSYLHTDVLSLQSPPALQDETVGTLAEILHEKIERFSGAEEKYLQAKLIYHALLKAGRSRQG